MRFHFYDAETGILHSKVYGTSIRDPQLAMESARANSPDGHLTIAGTYDHRNQRIDVQSGIAVDYKPPAPSDDHEWNADAKRWNLNAATVNRIASDRTARARITHLETNVQPRAIRESALNRPGAGKRLQDIDDEIAELRKQLDKGEG